jgi:thymidine kinase
LAQLRFYTGPMASGKSTLALQTAYNLEQSNLQVGLITMHDRSDGLITSRVGLEREAVKISHESNILHMFEDRTMWWDVLICDEAQFYEPEQIDQLASIVEDLNTDVYAYGLKLDFRGQLFPGSKRLIEMADVVHELQVDVRCYCGEPAKYNARFVDGKMVTEGETIVVGDIDNEEVVSYRLLCRSHFYQGRLFGR